MLNKAERFQALKVIQFWCRLGSLPAQVDLSTWQIFPHTKRLQTWKSHVLYFLFVLHALYKWVGLAYWLQVGIPLYQAVVHAVLAVVAPVYGCWYYISYIQSPRLFGVYLSMTLTGYQNEAVVDKQKARSWSNRLKECTLQDLFVMSLTYTMSFGIAGIMMALICYPSMKYLLFAVLPKEHQTWLAFGILLVEELRYLVVLTAMAIPIWILQVISFDLVGSRLQLLMDSMERAAHSGKSWLVYKSLRHIQLYVGIVNLINSYMIFSCKLALIAISIGAGYAAIAHFGDYFIFGITYYIIFISATHTYILCYDKAFKIPALFEKVTQRAMLATLREKSGAGKILQAANAVNSTCGNQSGRISHDGEGVYVKFHSFRG